VDIQKLIRNKTKIKQTIMGKIDRKDVYMCRIIIQTPIRNYETRLRPPARLGGHDRRGEIPMDDPGTLSASGETTADTRGGRRGRRIRTSRAETGSPWLRPGEKTAIDTDTTDSDAPFFSVHVGINTAWVRRLTSHA